MNPWLSFLDRLMQAALPPHCANPYHPRTDGGRQRRHNLQRYLQRFGANPPLLLVGEAPGYRGARLSGIPFVSPALLADPQVASGLFGVRNGFQMVAEWPHIRREASATIMWETLTALNGPLPLLWNAFPFHPHQPQQPRSNRTPTTAELALGRPFLEQLHQLAGSPPIAAVGKKAARALTNCNLPHQTLRHPSHGGKQAFQTGLRALYGA
jgi:uracil-DNA glycosylase